MQSGDTRSFGAVFDTVAAEYDRNRPTYPDELLDYAWDEGGLAAGDRVLEIGCGTGQLTGSLVKRGLNVVAVEPGTNLIAHARRRLTGPGEVEFVNARFEDAAFDGEFRAMFSGSAFHWVDPDVSWSLASRSLIPGGLLALVQYCGVRDEWSAADEDALMAAFAEAAPEIARSWPETRQRETLLAGVEDRRENVSEVWEWLGGQPVARSYAKALFGDVRIAVVPSVMEQTAEELNAFLRTTSLYHRLSSDQQEALQRANAAIPARSGRPIQTSLLAVVVTARSADA